MTHIHCVYRVRDVSFDAGLDTGPSHVPRPDFSPLVQSDGAPQTRHQNSKDEPQTLRTKCMPPLDHFCKILHISVDAWLDTGPSHLPIPRFSPLVQSGATQTQHHK